MSLLTIFTIPKAFEGRSGMLQANALRSWCRLPDVEVVLFGDDPGVAEFASTMDVKHEPVIETTDHGTPLISGAFTRVLELTSSPFLCYANADILLFEDFVATPRMVPAREFLAVAQRCNVDVEGELKLDSDADVSEFRARVSERGVPEPPWGSDVFVWPRHISWDMPPFAVGRPPWDNWMIYRAREMGMPVVDVTGSALVVHQNHDYGHVPLRRGRAWSGPETDRNRALVPNLDLVEHIGHLDGVTHVLRGGQLKRARGRRYLRAKLLALPVKYPVLQPFFQTGRRIFRSAKRARD